MTQKPILKIAGLTKSYHQLNVLRGIDLDVYAGGWTAAAGGRRAINRAAAQGDAVRRPHQHARPRTDGQRARSDARPARERHDHAGRYSRNEFCPRRRRSGGVHGWRDNRRAGPTGRNLRCAAECADRPSFLPTCREPEMDGLHAFGRSFFNAEIAARYLPDIIKGFWITSPLPTCSLPCRRWW